MGDLRAWRSVFAPGLSRPGVTRARARPGRCPRDPRDPRRAAQDTGASGRASSVPRTGRAARAPIEVAGAAWERMHWVLIVGRVTGLAGMLVVIRGRRR